MISLPREEGQKNVDQLDNGAKEGRGRKEGTNEGGNDKGGNKCVKKLHETNSKNSRNQTDIQLDSSSSRKTKHYRNKQSYTYTSHKNNVRHKNTQTESSTQSSSVM